MSKIRIEPKKLIEMLDLIDAGDLIYDATLHFSEKGMMFNETEIAHVMISSGLIKKDYFKEYNAIGEIRLSLPIVKKRIKDLFMKSEYIDISITGEQILFDSKNERMKINRIGDYEVVKQKLHPTRYGILMPSLVELNYLGVNIKLEDLKSMISFHDINIIFGDKITMKSIDETGEYEKDIRSTVLFNTNNDKEIIKGKVQISSEYFPRAINGIHEDGIILLRPGSPIIITKKTNSYIVSYTIAPMINQ